MKGESYLKKRQNLTNELIVVDWRSQAQEVLPELAVEIAAAANPMQLWTEIGFAFDAAYNEPRNEDLIRRIYSFASWCIEQPRSKHAQDDLFTCVVSFYEDIPMNKAARLDMTRWFTLEDVEENKQVFSYHLSGDDYEELLDLFASTKTDRRGKRGSLVTPRRKREP